ncbi:hypothetical protein KKG83_03390 [Candidatus Micrarchaeota archaeon]|nr:hypothetical protein [Candidatus Micrarchaeota archaeon]
MELNFSKKNIVFAVLVFLSVILWVYFLNSTELTLTEMLDLSQMNSTIDKLNSSNFIFFLLFFPLTIALITIQCKTEENKINSFIVSLGGVLLGLIASMFLFPLMQEYLLIGIFYLIGVGLAVEMIYTRLLELKKYVSLRILGTGIQRTTTILALGLFLLVAFTVNENHEYYSEKIDEELLKMAGGEQAKEQLTTGVVDAIVESHKQLADQITSLSSFQALENSSDPNAVIFHTGIIEMKDQLYSPKYRQQIIDEINKQNAVSDDQLKSVLSSVKEQMPLFGVIVDFLWLIEGFAFFSVFLLVSNTVFYVLTIIYGLLIEQVFALINK